MNSTFFGPVPEILGHGDGDEGRLDPLDGRGIGGRHDHHAAGQTLGTQVLLQKLADLTPALADQGDHVDDGVARIGDIAQQHALADAAAGEDPHSLASAAGQHAINRADAQGQRLGDLLASQGGGTADIQRTFIRSLQGAFAVDGLAQAVEHAAEDRVAEQDVPRGRSARSPCRRAKSPRCAPAAGGSGGRCEIRRPRPAPGGRRGCECRKARPAR